MSGFMLNDDNEMESDLKSSHYGVAKRQLCLDVGNPPDTETPNWYKQPKTAHLNEQLKEKEYKP